MTHFGAEYDMNLTIYRQKARKARAWVVLGRRVHSSNRCHSAGTRVRGESGRPRATQFLLLISDAGRAVTYCTHIRLRTLAVPRSASISMRLLPLSSAGKATLSATC